MLNASLMMSLSVTHIHEIRISLGYLNSKLMIGFKKCSTNFHNSLDCAYQDTVIGNTVMFRFNYNYWLTSSENTQKLTILSFVVKDLQFCLKKQQVCRNILFSEKTTSMLGGICSKESSPSCSELL